MAAGIVLREPGRNMPLQAVNGYCLGCDCGLAWILIHHWLSKGRRKLPLRAEETPDSPSRAVQD